MPLAAVSVFRTLKLLDVQALGKRTALAGLVFALGGCGFLTKGEAEAQSQRPATERGGPAAVDVAIARTGTLRQALEYTGTTRPLQEVSLRSQVEGQLLEFKVDVGDLISRGQALARVDDTLLVSAVIAAEAELAARESEVARSQTQVAEAQTQVEQARLRLLQAKADADRLQNLFKSGAIAQQQAELAQTEAGTAEQIFRSAQEQVRTQQQAVLAAQRRVVAQQAAVEQARERRSYAIITSPLTGSVLERVTEAGNLVQPGNEVLKLGDFSRVKVAVQVSELELSNIRVGQSAQVRLDAFPDQRFIGQVTRITPAADPTARLVPIEVTIPNPNGSLSSGLLARVSFGRDVLNRVIVPGTALVRQRQEPANPTDSSAGNSRGRPAARKSSLFVVAGEGEATQVLARSVTIGEQIDGKVEILSGLKPGERYVARSGRPLKDGEQVRLSILSEQ